MATILSFKIDEGRRMRRLPTGHSAEVVFFTGVRYELLKAGSQSPIAPGRIGQSKAAKTTA
ncbi:MAG: hypothetical protein WBF87_15725 [Mesorhizobium sp.]